MTVTHGTGMTSDHQPHYAHNSAIHFTPRHGIYSRLLHCIILHYPHSTPSAIMPKICFVCSAVTLQYCGACKSTFYCSRACQKEDWNKYHKQICKLLNVGHGDMQVRTGNHTSLSIDIEKGRRKAVHGLLDEDGKRFFKLFEESTFEGSQAAAIKMKKIAERKTKHNQNCLLYLSFISLVNSDSEMLSWPNSPLLVLLQFVDPNILFGHSPLPEEVTPLHFFANLADPRDYSTHKNQLIFAKQLIKHGANVNALTRPEGTSPLHNACCGRVVTNLDFVELLLKKGADPNAQDHLGLTPLMYTTVYAPGAAKFLLNWPTTNASITTRSGVSFLARVRNSMKSLSDQIVAHPDDPHTIQDQFLLGQWREIEEMLVERGAVDTGITTLD